MLNGDSHHWFGHVPRTAALIVLIVSGLFASIRLTSEVLAQPWEPPAQTENLVLKPGFPVRGDERQSAQSPAGPYINALVTNIDAEPRLEMVNAIALGGPLGAWNHDGTLVEGWPISGSPSIYGLSSAGQLDLTFPGLEIVTVYSLPNQTTHTLYAYSGHGDVLPGFPITLNVPITSAPVLFDFDGDGIDEIVIATDNGRLYAYQANGALIAGWPVAISGTNTGTPVIVDLDRDGELDVVVTSTDSTTPGHSLLYALHVGGTPLPGFPVSFRYELWGASRYPVVGDVDGDGALEIVVAAWSSDPIIRVYGSDAALEHELTVPYLRVNSVSPAALGDLDGDNVPEIIAQSQTYMNVWRGDGTPFHDFPSSYFNGWVTNSAPVIGDITGDNKPEIIGVTRPTAYTSQYQRLYVFDRDGALLDDVGMSTGSGGVPAIADIDLDGRNEIVALANYGGSLVTQREMYYAFEWADSGTSGPLQWGQFNNGTRHNGVYVPLASRSVDLAISMIDEPDPTPVSTSTIYHLAITNSGSGAATHVTLNDTLPADADLITISGADDCAQDGGVLTCDLGTIINGEERLVALEVRARHAGTLTNYASVHTTATETTLSNNLASATTTVLPGADLGVAVTANQARYTAGDTVIYTVTLTNDGPDDTTGVVVTDGLPAELTFESSAADRGTYDDTTGEWTVGDMAVGELLQLILTATIPGDSGTVLLHNEAAISASDIEDPDTSNQTSYVENPVDVVDLVVGLMMDNEWPLEGDTLTLPSGGGQRRRWPGDRRRRRRHPAPRPDFNRRRCGARHVRPGYRPLASG